MGGLGADPQAKRDHGESVQGSRNTWTYDRKLGVQAWNIFFSSLSTYITSLVSVSALTSEDVIEEFSFVPVFVFF